MVCILNRCSISFHWKVALLDVSFYITFKQRASVSILPSFIDILASHHKGFKTILETTVAQDSQLLGLRKLMNTFIVSI